MTSLKSFQTPGHATGISERQISTWIVLILEMWCQQKLFKKAGDPVCGCPWDTGLASALPFSLRCDLQGLSEGLGFVPFVSWPFDLPGCRWCWTVWGAELTPTKPTSHKDIKLLTKAMLLAQTEEEAIFQLQWEVYISAKSFLKIHTGCIFLMSQVFILGRDSLPFPCLDTQVASTWGNVFWRKLLWQRQIKCMCSGLPGNLSLRSYWTEIGRKRNAEKGNRVLHLKGDPVMPPCSHSFLALGLSGWDVPLCKPQPTLSSCMHKARWYIFKDNFYS